jgi:hypothetical protein
MCVALEGTQHNSLVLSYGSQNLPGSRRRALDSSSNGQSVKESKDIH